MQYLDLRVGFVSLCSWRLPKDGTPYLNMQEFHTSHELYFVQSICCLTYWLLEFARYEQREIRFRKFM